MDSRKKILAISLEGARRAQAVAMWDGTNIILVGLQDISGDAGEWLPPMLDDIHAKLKEGWVVLVDDRTHSFPADVITFDFDDTSYNGRTNLQNALDWYFALDGRGGVIFDPAIKRFAMSIGNVTSLLEASHDERGRLVYNVDWLKFTAGHRALLMCVAGAVMEEPLSEHWMRQFVGYLPERSPKHRWGAVGQKLNRILHRQFEEAVDATEARKTCSA